MLNMFREPSDPQLYTWIIIGGLSAWGGLVRYLMDIQGRPTKWSWVGVFSQIIISCFTGLLGGLLSFEAGASHYMTFIMSGLCGSMGSSVLVYLWQRSLNSPEKLK